MDFELVLVRLIAEFSRLKIRHAAIGGFALGALGTPRQTMDLDFLVCRDDLEKLDDVLIPLGYTLVFRSENVSQYSHSEPAWGGLDFIHAFRKISLGMLDRAKDLPVLGGKHSLKTAQPEDVIGLKVQAMSNDPERWAQDQRDIEGLMDRYGSQLDWNRIVEYYDAFGFADDVKTLREKYDHAK